MPEVESRAPDHRNLHAALEIRANRIVILEAREPSRRSDFRSSLTVAADDGCFRMCRHNFGNASHPGVADPVVIVDEANQLVTRGSERTFAGEGEAQPG